MTKTQKLIAAVAAFVVIEILLIKFVDLPLSLTMRQVEARNPGFTDFFRTVTDIGKSEWYLWGSSFGILLGAVILRLRVLNERYGVIVAKTCHDLMFLFAGVAFSGILTNLLKQFFGRARPVEMLRHNNYGFYPLSFQHDLNSFPSGHSTTVMALATILAVLFPRHRLLWVVLAALLALSRVIVNAHYLADIVAGTAVGTLTTLSIARLRNDKGMFPKMSGFFPIDKKHQNE